MSESKSKYENGKIYKIVNVVNDDVYVGSTYNMLCRRMEKHRSHRTQYAHRPLYKLMNEIGVDKFRIELIEDYPCSNKENLRKREGYFIRQMGTLNVVIEDRTAKEYKETNKELIQAKWKEYYETHKDKLIEKARGYRATHKEEQKQYKLNNTEHILAQNKEYYQRAKEHKQEYQKSDKVKAWKSTKHECPCGGSYVNSSKAGHFKCARHQNYEESLKQPI